MERVKVSGRRAFIVVCILIAIYLCLLAFAWGFNYQAHTYQKGQAVTVISNTTEIKDDQVCQKIDNANISYTGEKDKNWFRLTPGTLYFPNTQYYVIKNDGTQLWVDESNIEKFDANKVWCSPQPQK